MSLPCYHEDKRSIINLDESAGVPLELLAGDVSFQLHTLLMHRSGPNKSRKTRIGIGISYIPTHVHLTKPACQQP